MDIPIPTFSFPTTECAELKYKTCFLFETEGHYTVISDEDITLKTRGTGNITIESQNNISLISKEGDIILAAPNGGISITAREIPPIPTYVTKGTINALADIDVTIDPPLIP